MSDPPAPDAGAAAPIRLQKVLARAGMGSRRACDDIIAAGRVTVDGTTAVLGARVDPATAVVLVDGIRVGVAEGLTYYLAHKPLDVITTADDPHGRPTAVDLVPASPRVFPVGRLDADTEGLLILTNDGDLTHRLTHPSFGVEKEYLVEVTDPLGRGALRRLREGVELDDGMTAPARVSAPDDRTVRIVIHEGRNRQVRRMCEAVGSPVRRLVRTRIGPITDRDLAPGEWRPLQVEEVRALERAAAGSTRAPSEPGPDGGR